MINYIIDDAGSPENERNDCSVRAMSIATKTSYLKSYIKFNMAGRKRNGAFYISKILKANSIHFNYRFKKLRLRKPILLKDFIKKYPVGIFYVEKSCHVFVVRDGVVIDIYKPGPLVRIISAWEVIEV